MPRIATAGGIISVIAGHTPVLPFFNFGPEVIPGKAFVKLDPIQVVGLVHLSPCVPVECRTFREVCSDCNVVFGNTGDLEPTYENDFSTFLLDFSIYPPNQTATIIFKLQKWFEGQWRDAPFGLDLNNNNNGIFYPLESISTHPSYAGYAINWGQVLQNAGAGIYRFRVESTFKTIKGCLVSPPYQLLAWDCHRAKGTVKFETWLKGKVGEKRKDYILYDLCDLTAPASVINGWYDSIRVRGWFGYYTVPEYKEVLLEWGKPKHGKIERISDEAIQAFEYKSKYLPFYIHHRFSVYAMMADELRVSDYNLNNSDYDIKRLVIVKNGGYEPEYADKDGLRKGKVEVIFNRGVQGVIKSICCEFKLNNRP